MAWQSSIKKTGVASDWMVVVVEAPDSKKVNKFPLRTTVLEKLKQEVTNQLHVTKKKLSLVTMSGWRKDPRPVRDTYRPWKVRGG